MDTNKLIDSLGEKLTPVRPVAPPALTAIAFVIAMLGVILGGLYVGGFMREDIAALVQTPDFRHEAALLVSAALLSALAAFRLSIPDTRVRKPIMVSILAASAIWLVACAVHCADALLYSQPLTTQETTHGIHCVRDLAALMLLPLVTAIVMSTRAAPVWTGYAAYCMTLSVASIATVTLRLVCANDASDHLLIWHFLPALVFSGLGVALGRYLSAFLTRKEKIS